MEKHLKEQICMYMYNGLPDGLVVKSPPANAGGVGSIPGSGRSLEKEMATPSCILAWEIPRTEEPGRLQSMGSQKVGQYLVTKTTAATYNWITLLWFSKLMQHYKPPVLKPSLRAQLVKNPLTVQDTWVWFLGWEDSLEKGKATHSNILTWRIPWTI